jgi:hypothetical protein
MVSVLKTRGRSENPVAEYSFTQGDGLKKMGKFTAAILSFLLGIFFKFLRLEKRRKLFQKADSSEELSFRIFAFK